MISQIDDEDGPKDIIALKDTIHIIRGMGRSEANKENADDLLNLEINSFLLLPNVTTFVDYFMMTCIRNIKSSANEFYDNVFEEIPQLEDDQDIEAQNTQRDRISSLQLKNMYEQMCFLDRNKEEELFSSDNLAI